MDYTNKETLLGVRHTDTSSGYPEEDIPIPGLGMVRVRGLSRHEVLHIQAVKTVAAVERMTVSLGMVDPPMTEDDVKRWQKVSVGGELDEVTRTIGRLSGMLSDSPKQAYRDFEADPGSEFRLSASEGPQDDGGATTTGNV